MRQLRPKSTNPQLRLSFKYCASYPWSSCIFRYPPKWDKVYSSWSIRSITSTDSVTQQLPSWVALSLLWQSSWLRSVTWPTFLSNSVSSWSSSPHSHLVWSTTSTASSLVAWPIQSQRFMSLTLNSPKYSDMKSPPQIRQESRTNITSLSREMIFCS